MTGPTHRDIESSLDDLDDDRDDEPDPMIIYQDPATDEWFADPECTEPVDPDVVDPIMLAPKEGYEGEWNPDVEGTDTEGDR